MIVLMMNDYLQVLLNIIIGIIYLKENKIDGVVIVDVREDVTCVNLLIKYIIHNVTIIHLISNKVYPHL